MRVVSKTEAADHVFSSISKEEVQPISAYLTSKNVRLKNEMDDAMDVDPISDDDIEEDDDASIPSEDEKPRKKDKKPVAKARDDDEQSESGESPGTRNCFCDISLMQPCRGRGLYGRIVRRRLAIRKRLGRRVGRCFRCQ
jgi:structure-specific recognition protein 1